MAVPKLRFPGFTDDWEQHKYEDFCTIVTKQTGFDYTSTIKKSLIKESVEGSLPYLQTKNFTGTTIDYNTDYYIPEKVAREFPKINLNEKCVLFSIVGASVGNIGLFPGNKHCFLSGAICVSKFIDETDADYLYHFMCSDGGQSQIRNCTKGGAQATVTIEDIRNFDVKTPSKNERDKIGQFLNNLDHLITLHQCECNELQELKKSMLQKMFPKAGKTVPEIRFPGFDGEWERMPLRNVTTQSLDKNSKNQDIPVYSVTNHSGFIPQEDTFVNGEVASQNKKTYRIVKKNQFAYNPTRINVGSIDYLRDIEKVIVSPLYVVFMCNDNVDPAFIKLFSLTNDFKNQRQDNTEVGVRDTLKYDRFSNILISLPSLKEQQKIGSFFKEIDNRIELQKQLLDEIKEYKKGLLQQMFC